MVDTDDIRRTTDKAVWYKQILNQLNLIISVLKIPIQSYLTIYIINAY